MRLRLKWPLLHPCLPMAIRSFMQAFFSLIQAGIHILLFLNYVLLYNTLFHVECICWHLDQYIDTTLTELPNPSMPQSHEATGTHRPWPRHLKIAHEVVRCLWRCNLRCLAVTYQLHQRLCSPSYALPPEAYRVSDCTFISTGPTTDYNYN